MTHESADRRKDAYETFYIVELADFVAAKKAHAGKIVALDVEIHAELFAQSVEPNQRGREKAKVRARLLVKQRMQLFKSVHG